MVPRAAAKGRTTSAKTVQASQVFSQAHLRAYFIGIVKLAFVTPATIRIAIPHEVLFMMRLPRCDSFPLFRACFTTVRARTCYRRTQLYDPLCLARQYAREK